MRQGFAVFECSGEFNSVGFNAANYLSMILGCSFNQVVACLFAALAWRGAVPKSWPSTRSSHDNRLQHDCIEAYRET